MQKKKKKICWFHHEFIGTNNEMNRPESRGNGNMSRAKCYAVHLYRIWIPNNEFNTKGVLEITREGISIKINMTYINNASRDILAYSRPPIVLWPPTSLG